MLKLVRRAIRDEAYAGEAMYVQTGVADALGDADLAVAALRRELEAEPGFGEGTMAQYSHVAFWNAPYSGLRAHPGFKALQDSGKYSFGLGERTAAICPPILGIDPRPLCKSLNDDTIRVIRESKPDIVVLYAWWHEGKVKGRYKDTSGLEPTVAELKKAGVKRIVLLGAVPYWREDLPKLLLKVWREQQRIPLRLGDEYLDPHVKAATAEMRQRAKAMGIEFISGMDFFCNAQGCLSRLSEDSTQPLSYDYGHLSLPAVK